MEERSKPEFPPLLLPPGRAAGCWLGAGLADGCWAGWPLGLPDGWFDGEVPGFVVPSCLPGWVVGCPPVLPEPWSTLFQFLPSFFCQLLFWSLRYTSPFLSVYTLFFELGAVPARFTPLPWPPGWVDGLPLSFPCPCPCPCPGLVPGWVDGLPPLFVGVVPGLEFVPDPGLTPFWLLYTLFLL